MINLLVGALAMAAILLTVEYARRGKIYLAWWQWLLSVLTVIYAMFVVLLVIEFLKEGATQAALVMSLIMGVPAVIFVVLFVRFAFGRTQKMA
jgi:hypothetical protein